MSKKKIIILSIIFLLILVCLYISLSYSYYMIGNKVVEIETAMETPDCVGITTSGEAFSLNKDYAVPITNSQFLNSKKETQDIYKYTFTINNNCQNMDLNGLEIGLVPLEGSNISISNLKYILIKTKDNSNSFTEDNINSFSDEDVKKLPKGMIQELRNSYDEEASNVYPVGLASFEGENSVSYDLYVWLGDEAENDTMNGEFKAAVVVYKEESTAVDPKLQVLLNTPVGDEGEFLQHTSDLANSAGDGGYRYSGNQPNNYICFGSGSEGYNKGNTDVCDIGNKYRIIGYVPVTINGEQQFRVKVIKAEYLSPNDFKEADGEFSFDTLLGIDISLKKTESESETISAYKWNDERNNTWAESTLYASLKSNDYLNEAFGDTWLSKIENVTWNLNEVKILGLETNPKAVYDDEMAQIESIEPVQNQIGLMYVHDYGFANISDCWGNPLYDYDNRRNMVPKNNWLFNGFNEWTISSSSIEEYAIGTFFAGYAFERVKDATAGVRPVFYLTTDTVLDNSNGANGTKERPLKVAI